VADGPFEPHPRWSTAILGGIALTVAMVAAGLWALTADLPLLWLFIGPWVLVGLLLVLWGWQRRPRR